MRSAQAASEPWPTHGFAPRLASPRSSRGPPPAARAAPAACHRTPSAPTSSCLRSDSNAALGAAHGVETIVLPLELLVLGPDSLAAARANAAGRRTPLSKSATEAFFRAVKASLVDIAHKCGAERCSLKNVLFVATSYRSEEPPANETVAAAAQREEHEHRADAAVVSKVEALLIEIFQR